MAEKRNVQIMQQTESGLININPATEAELVKTTEGATVEEKLAALGIDIAELGSSLSTHAANSDIHLTSVERNRWDGNVTSYVYDTVAAMNAWLEDGENKAKLKTGDNLFIRNESEPDFWWDGEKAVALSGEKVTLDGYYTKGEVDTALSNKVDKVGGKQLSTEDYTTSEKNKLAGLAAVATSGSYADLSNRPSIPKIVMGATAPADLQNGDLFLQYI